MPDALILAAGCLLLFVPGAVLLTAARIRVPSWWTLAPAVSVLAFSVLGGLYAALGIPFTPVTALGGLLLAAGCGLVVSRHPSQALTGRHLTRDPPGPARWGPAWASSDRPTVTDAALAVSTVAVLTVLSATSIGAMHGLSTLNNSYDAFFHTSALAFMRRSGDVSAWTGMAPMYWDTPHFYPTGFHAVAALMPAPVVVSANAVVLVLLSAVFFAAAGGLADAVLPGRREDPVRALVVVAAASSVLVLRSIDAMGLVFGLWPNLLGAVLLPSAVAAAVLALRAWRRSAGISRAGLSALVVVVVAGAVVAHPSSAMNLGVVLAAVLIVRVAGGVLARDSVRRWWPSALLLVIGTVGFLVASTTVLGGMGITELARQPLASVLVQFLVDRPRIPVVPMDAAPMLPWLAVATAGALLGLRRRRPAAATAAVTAGITLLLMVSTQAETAPLADLANAWYGAPERLTPLWAVSLIVLVGTGLIELGTRMQHRRWPRPATAMVAVALFAAGVVVMALPTRLPVLAALVTTDGHGHYLPYVAPEERDFIEEAADSLPPDAVVLGDPLDGTVAFWTVGDIDVVYPSLAPPGTLDTRRVGQNAGQIGENSDVCESARDLGVTHLYRDHGNASGDVIANRSQAEPWAGLDDIDAELLTLVGQQGPWVLYEVDLPC